MAYYACDAGHGLVKHFFLQNIFSQLRSVRLTSALCLSDVCSCRSCFQVVLLVVVCFCSCFLFLLFLVVFAVCFLLFVVVLFCIIFSPGGSSVQMVVHVFVISNYIVIQKITHCPCADIFSHQNYF